MFQNTAHYLANRACPSISYRIQKELLHVNRLLPEMIALQESILKEQEIQRICRCAKTMAGLADGFMALMNPNVVSGF